MTRQYSPLETVKLLFIGLGQRGRATLRRLLVVEHVEVAGLCDTSNDAMRQARAILPHCGVECFTDWRMAVAESDADLVVISTDWATHTPIAIGAMSAGKEVAVEVPAAMSVADCERLVDAARTTGRRCTMLENCCYDPFALRTLAMAKKGLFGQLTHFEGAYIHDLRKLYAENRWYARFAVNHAGNPYPTHGFGPICQLLAQAAGADRPTSLVSMTTRPFGGKAPLNTTLISTEQGRTILLHHDVSTPRPYSRKQNVCGTLGYISKYPTPMLTTDNLGLVEGERLDSLMAEYKHPYELAYEADAERLGVVNRMNYYMDRRLIDAMLEGKPMDISTSDAALWSSITELSAFSAKSGGCPVDIPRFDA